LSANPKLLEFITKAGCHLCDEALPIVRREASRYGWSIVERSVLDDDELMADYGLRIPVVLLNGDPVAEGLIEPGEVEAVLASV